VQTDVGTVNAATGGLVGMTTVTGASGTGGGSGDVLPGFTQGLLRLFTGAFSGGRQVRGRLFIPGQIEGTNNGQPSGSVMGNWSGAGTTLVSDANSIWCVYSRVHGDAFDITSVSSWGEWASLRSRRR